MDEARRYWDDAAASFDDEPDHGLGDPQVRCAWTALLQTWLPARATEVLDVGCGTGSLSVVMARLGHAVSGIDFSSAMIAQARAKASALGYPIEFHEMDAAAPQFPPHAFEVLVCRHLLWALTAPAQVLRRWVELLRPDGRLLLIEGYWQPGGGLHAGELLGALPPSVTVCAVQDLSDQPEYWGKEVTDERYLIVADVCRA